MQNSQRNILKWLARKTKNWERADEIRLFFKEKGINIDDSESGIIIK